MKLVTSWLFILVLILGAWVAPALSADDKTIGLAVYSDLNYVQDEGEFYGLQIAVVPFSGGRKLLWRSASGHLQKPLLLDFTEAKGVINVQLPPTSDDAGNWSLKIVGNMLHAVGPRALKFDLRKLTIK